MRLRCDWMTEPCSTMSMVIRPYENRNTTVSNGRRVRFFFGTWIAGTLIGGTSIGITAV